MDTSFRDRFNAWKQGKTVYKNGLRISFDEGKDADPEQTVEQPDLSAALDYVRGVKRDVLLNFDEGKDVAGGHHFNAIKQISPNAGLSYGSYYDKLTGDWMIDARRQGLPRFGGGKNSGFRPTPRQIRTINVIVQNLRDAGFNDYDIAGILANGKIESSFDPAAVNKSDHRGVWQNETVRHRGVSKVYGDHSLGSQIKYLIDWESAGGVPNSKLNNDLAAHGDTIFKKGTYKSAREAALAFERAYERSNGQIMGGRLNQADMIYDWLRATSPGSIVVNSSNTDRPLIGSRRIIPPTQRVVTTTPPPAAPTNAGLWDNLATPRPLVPYDDGKDVDTRSDTTRQGYHEGNIPWGAGLDSGGQGPLWLLENVGAGMNNPYLITGHAPAVGMRADITNRIIAGTRKYAGKVNTKKLSPAYKEIEARYGDTYNPDDLEIWQKNAMPLIRRDAIKKHKGEYVLEDGNDFVLMKNRKSIADARAYSEDGVLTPEMVYKSDPSEHHVTRRLYSGMIERQLQGGGKGLASGEYWVSGPATNKEIQNFERTRLGNYGVHENTNLVSENAPTRVVNSEAEARAVNAKGQRYVYNNAPVYLLTKPAVNIPIKNRNVFDPRTLDVNGVHVPNFNSRSRFQAMLPFAIGGGLWATEDKHNRGKDVPQYRGGKDSDIYIKPSHRGRFTKLKQRTGHSASWFKENGTPAQKKMAVFALNAKKWKH